MMRYSVICADAVEFLRQLPDCSVNCCVTSPPYFGLRDYGVSGQIGLERTPEEYVVRMVDVFREVRRVLADDGTVWLNLGDSYAGSWGNQGRKEERGTQRPINGRMIQPVHDGRYAKRTNTGKIPLGSALKPKDLIGIPWRVAFALQSDGWYLRSDIIWHKTAPMPESVKDRPTRAHEYVFLLSKSERYFYDSVAIAEPCVVGFNGSSFTSAYDIETKPGLGNGNRIDREIRNKRTVWTIGPDPFHEAHFAVMPAALVEPCVLAGSKEGGTVIDPFTGSGTVGVVAIKCGRNFVGCDLNPNYVVMARRRLASVMPMFAEEVPA